MWTPENQNGFWVWYPKGNWLDYAVNNNMGYVLVKAGDGGNDFNGGQFSTDLVQAVHDRGLACVAWTYCYLDNPQAEARNALLALERGADAVVLDIEYEAIGKFDQAETLVTTIKNNTDKWVGYAPDLRIAFGNHWPGGGFNPNLSPFPWEILNRLDGVMPQLYWVDFAQPALRTLELANEWVRGCQGQGWPVPKVYPVFPCTATGYDTLVTAKEAVRQGFSGVNIWRWDWGNYLICISQLGTVQWPQSEPTPDPGEEEDQQMIEELRGQVQTLLTYIGEIGAPDGGVVTALDAELQKKTPSKAEVKNVRNRIVALYHEATGQ